MTTKLICNRCGEYEQDCLCEPPVECEKCKKYASELSALQKENAELKSRLGAPRRMYPIAGGQSVPFEVMIPFESASQSNHSQSINRIAERGGFSPEEAWAIVNNLKWRQIMVMGLPEAARQWDEYATRINQHYAELDSLRTQNRELREMCKVKDEALQQAVRNCRYQANTLRGTDQGMMQGWLNLAEKCDKALALQPEAPALKQITSEHKCCHSNYYSLPGYEKVCRDCGEHF